MHQGAPYDLLSRAQMGLRLLDDGLTPAQVADQLSVTTQSVRNWRAGNMPAEGRLVPIACPRCEGTGLDGRGYAHLLGLYLGDGHIVRHARGRYVLSIYNDMGYEGLIDECMDSVARVHPSGGIWIARKPGCAAIQSAWKHWPCLFPQHGPGVKHKRPIVLEPWQIEIVEQHTDRFVRGLLHSDGCRCLNRITRHFPSGDRTYVYPRWFFTNESRDILELCEWGLDRLGVEHRRNRPNCVSIARKGSVAILDELVGEKY